MKFTLADNDARAFVGLRIAKRMADIRANGLRRRIARGEGVLTPQEMASLRRELSEQTAESSRIAGLMTAEAVRLAGPGSVVDGFDPRSGVLEVRK